MKTLSAVCSTLLAVCATTQTHAELVIASFDVKSTIDFDSTVSGVNFGAFTGAGISGSPTSGQLDSSAWTITGFNSSSDLSRGTSAGGVTTGGLYSFTGPNGSSTLGIQPGGSDFTPGSIVLSIQNNTGSKVDSWAIEYDLFSFNDQNRANSMSFAFSSDNSNFTGVPALDFTSPGPADGSPEWTLAERSITIDISIENGDSLFISWTGDDVSGSDSRDEFALDNIGVTALAAVPEPTAFLFGSLVAGSVGMVVARRRPAREPLTDAA